MDGDGRNESWFLARLFNRPHQSPDFTGHVGTGFAYGARHDLFDQIHGIEKTISDTGVTKYTGKRTETDWLDDRAWSFFLSVYSLNDETWNFTSLDYERINKPNRGYEAWIRGEDV